MKKFLFILFFLLSFIQIFSQPRQPGSATIEGYVFDESSSVPMEFANIVLFRASDSTQVTGTVTNSKGYFILENIRGGNYYLRVSFIGFENKFIDKIQVRGPAKIDLGKIYLKPKTIQTGDVVVSGERAQISYQIDKKVINVAESFSSVSGTAVDVLENVPSITVDVEGNVSLRGSGSFTVLIDGKPSILEGSEALQQIPASAIESIEIITNPSAKYDPEGTAGIINIVMKKNKNIGISGILNLNGGLRNKYGGEAVSNFKNEDFQAEIGIDYNNRNFYMNTLEQNWNDDGNKITYYNSNGRFDRKMNFFGLRGSVTFDLGNKNNLTLGGRFGGRDFGGNSNLNYSEWNSLSEIKSNYISKTEDSRSGDFYSLFANYNHPFEDKGHEISAEIFFSSRKSNDESTNKLFEIEDIIKGKQTTEEEPENNLRTKIDYTLPLGQNSKFEAGYQGQIEISSENYKLYDYNPNTNQFEFVPQFSNKSDFYSNELAFYSLYSSKISTLGYQLGLRTEYTGREVKIPETNQLFKVDRWDFFPTIHLSYEIMPGHQVMSSYTRRINRPRGWEFEPFLTWMDAYNVRMGNPALLPELIDSYELSYQALLGRTVFSLDVYYRVTNNKIEHIRSVYSENVALQTVDNIGKDYSLGTELFLNFDLIKNWNINLMGNLYNYKIEGVLNNLPFSRNSFNWNLRFNNNIKLFSTTQLQLNLMYNSPTVSSQGKREGFVSTNIGIRQDLLGKMLTATLQIRDLFGASKFKSENSSYNFYNYRSAEREWPIVMLNLRFNFNNYKNDRRNQERQNDMEVEPEFEN
ncbi:outer membrane beta-barrel family protein [Rosettibacter firmus]|uniref:outer membrane beta-barrel family protein n=1 Tax=Rosettibacter firmus TaxID=3111522 RepID=UPI00336BB6A2